ncbi:FadR/GntR family transcriptional regulator [Alkalihalobacterium sp. APHAB7]|uniref:FadR/GntR family transcriptional regulator n=1 Tax=Alkalihalobacterium sp. APHAB7 TaxID=3402081 RepID=UPI003AAB21D4
MKVKRTSLVDDVVSAFIQDVEEGKYESSKKLPSQKDLAEYYQVSLIVLREALSKLSAIGLVSFHQGKGTYLNKEGRSSTSSDFSSLIFHDVQNLRSIIEARQLIEKETSYLAAKRRTSEDLMEIEKAINGMRENFDQMEMFAKWDLEFHIAVAKASKNPVMQRVITLMIESYRKQVHKFFSIPDVVERVFREHELIYEHIRDGKAKEASRVMYSHFELPERVFSLMLEEK